MKVRRWLLAEALLLLAPATVLTAMGFVWSARLLGAAVRDGRWGDPATWMAVGIAAGLVGTLSGWWLLVRYWRGGPGRLARGAAIAWVGAGIGFLAALGGAWLTAQGNGWIFAIGLPSILPLAHLWHLGRAGSS